MRKTANLQTEQINLFLKKANHLVPQGKKEPLLGIKWLDISTLPTLRWRNSEEEVPLQVVYYFISTFVETKGIMYTNDSKSLFLLLDKYSVYSFLDAVIERWQRDNKNKWVLGMIALLGQEKYLPIFKELVSFFAGWNGVMGANTIDAMSLIPSKQTLQEIVLLQEKIVCKPSLLACNRVLDRIKIQLNFNQQELLDYVIPNFNFNQSAIWAIDYGSRQFEIQLQQDFSFTVKNTKTKKTYKNLPKVGKKDFEEIASQSLQYYKNQKHLLKEEVRRQKTRLLNSFISWRQWNSSQWKDVFMQHPIMNRLGQGLLWGVYENNRLKVAFRMTKEGYLITLHGEMYHLVPNLKIGLVHPLELSYEEKMEWTVQFDEQSLKMPFRQLSRPIYTEIPTQNRIQNFMGCTIHISSLRAQLLYSGWKRGVVSEDGKVYEYVKKINDSLTAKVHFSGEIMGYYEEEQGYVILHDLVLTESFYKVPRRIFSELFYEMRKIANTAEHNEKVAS